MQMNLRMWLTGMRSGFPTARDEEFGLTRLQDLLTRHATRALPEIWDLIMREVREYGPQQDDQSLLLLRVLDPAIQPGT